MGLIALMRGAMPLLWISLQDGFSNEMVVVSVNGKEVFSKESVNTRQQIGVAAAVEVDVPQGSVDITVGLPLRNSSDTLTISAINTPYIGISLTNDGIITHRTSSEPFKYI
jgi:hypothetical protein